MSNLAIILIVFILLGVFGGVGLGAITLTTNTLLIILVVVLLLGGGGYYWRRR